MTVETEYLDEYEEGIAKMLVFPPPLQVREVVIKPGFVIFMFTMNGNEATTTIAYERGSVQSIAKILDTMPYPTFVNGDAFLIMAAFMGGVVTSVLNFKNPNHPDNQAEEAEAAKEKVQSKK